MSLVQDLTPINLEEEKQKFFDSGFKYSPQFKYNKLITLNQLYKYGKPKPEYLELAKYLLEKAFHSRTEEDIRRLEGKKIDKNKAKVMLKKFLCDNTLTKEISVKWSESFPSKASFYKNTLKLQLPLWHHEKEFLGTLYHEVGTHALRRINHLHQPFYNKKSQLGFKEYLFTEEGLASFHTLLAKNFKIDYMGALKYCACEIAQNSSFIETFQFIKKYLNDYERAWLYTYGLKKGIYNTQQPGGFTKNITYFEGINQVWNYFQKTNFDVESLYIGKIDVEDVKKAKEMNPNFLIKLPSFIQKDIEKYTDSINQIAKLNLLID